MTVLQPIGPGHRQRADAVPAWIVMLIEPQAAPRLVTSARTGAGRQLPHRPLQAPGACMAPRSAIATASQDFPTTVAPAQSP